tara:strand:+ start:985 stop:1131 length:147 start_codon:yes stop_codon:yes gene_type:complete
MEKNDPPIKINLEFSQADHKKLQALAHQAGMSVEEFVQRTIDAIASPE